MIEPIIQVYITKWCRDCSRVIKNLEDFNVTVNIIDIDKNIEGEKLVRSVNRGFRSVPTIIFPDGSILVEPTQVVLEEKLKTFKKNL